MINRHRVRSKGSFLDYRLEKEFQYMLTEFNNESSLVNERRRRIEQVIALYITIITALIAASVATINFSNREISLIIILGECLLAAIIGFIVFVALLALIAEVATSHGYLHLHRLYFVERFPNIRNYINVRTEEQIGNIWRVYFNRSTIIFLQVFALFNSTLISISIAGTFFWFVLILNYGRNFLGIDVFFLIGFIGLIVLILGFLLERKMIFERIRRTNLYINQSIQKIRKTTNS